MENAGMGIDVIFKSPSGRHNVWQSYYQDLRGYAEMSPDVRHYISLAKKHFKEIDVSIKGEATRYFNIKKSDAA
jgi:hypothetical protein